MKPIRVVVNDKMQRKYVYYRTEPVGKNFHPDFKPQLTPKQMLELGVFGGKYMTDCADEFPEDWFDDAKLCAEKHDPKLNYFGVNASQPLSVWRRRVGSTRTIRAAGSSGIAAITWAAAAKMMSGRSNAGRRSAARRASEKELQARRHEVPPQAAAGVAALGV